jgi:probable rRNA maturation factor
MTATPKFALTIQVASRTPGIPTRAEFRRWAKAALIRNVVATLRIVDEAEGLELNRDYRDQDHATNVLTFAYGAGTEEGELEGDMVLCAPVIEREAREQGKSQEAHYAHMTVHAMLHLQGYDHVMEAEAVAMEAVESFIMSRLGYPDPYQDG